MTPTIITQVAVQDGGQHQGLVQQGVDPLFVGLDPNNTVLGERPGSIGQQPDALQHVLDYDRFEHVQFKLSIGTGDRNRGVVAHNLSSNHSYRFTLSGVDLPRHNTATRLVLRQTQLP